MALPDALVADVDAVAPARAQIKVLIADDHPLIIAGMRRAIEHADDLRVVGEARSGAELMRLVQRRRPDLVLMDLKMPGSDGIDAIEDIRRRWPEVRTVVLSASDDRVTIDAALRAGASAYVLKGAHPIDIASVLRRAADGTVSPAPTSRPAALTERERSILSAVASGMTSAAISRELWISPHTITFHLRNIYRKLGVADRAGAVRHALEHGLI